MRSELQVSSVPPRIATMKAIRLHVRGGPEKLVYEDVPKPVPLPDEALVRVYACGVTPTELSWSSTERLPVVLGHEIAGVVEALGPDVTEVRVSDAVYALTDFWRDGGAAEYVVVRGRDLAPKPKFIDYVQAAAVPLSALTAWQALFDQGGLTKSQKILIHGAAGGVGSFAVQLARWRGARVTATASARNFDYLRGLGAEDVIDYATEKFENRVYDADMVLDLVGGDTLERSWGVLRRGGVLVTTVAPVSQEIASTHSVQGIFFIVKPSRPELMEIARLINGGYVRPKIEAVFPLERAREAFERGLSRHVRGKFVLQVIGN
ncbi:MAG TPA: NADP-dependent oxidoreductase [Thermodesulfobacteriota bacterium]|nr:NADP-dependent oxidoreductase [Thermodesulfobacteriota bacterium]